MEGSQDLPLKEHWYGAALDHRTRPVLQMEDTFQSCASMTIVGRALT